MKIFKYLNELNYKTKINFKAHRKLQNTPLENNIKRKKNHFPNSHLRNIIKLRLSKYFFSKIKIKICHSKFSKKLFFSIKILNGK